MGIRTFGATDWASSASFSATSISQPVAVAAAVVVGGLLAVILVVWLARRVLHRLIGLAVSVLVALATHSGTQAWIDHLIATHHG